MGCWGITALESDNGLDAVRCVRYNLPADGQLDLGEMLERLKKDRWNAPCDVKLGCAHTSPTWMLMRPSPKRHWFRAF